MADELSKSSATTKTAAISKNADVPEWLNEAFLTKHLRDYYKNDAIQIISFEAKSTKGENFASSIYKVNAHFSKEANNATGTANVSLVVKEAISDEVSLNVFLQFDAYNKEIEFYMKILPKYNAKLRELNADQMFPEAFGVCEQRKILILEDLSTKGYQIDSVGSGFNILQTQAILQKMAIFHAIGAVLHEEDADIFTNIKYGHISRGTNGFNNVYSAHLEIVLEILSERPGFDVQIEKLQRIRNELFERGNRIYDVNPNHFNTLNHDDLWRTNLMMKPPNPFDDNPYANIVFIDFQFAYWSSPSTDLYFFLNTSVDDSLRPHRFYEFVEFYHKLLVEYLEKLKYKSHIPTWTEFYLQYRERKFLAFIMSCLVQPMMINNTEKIGAKELILNDENGMKGKRSLYKNDKIRDNIRKLVSYYDEIGVFD